MRVLATAGLATGHHTEKHFQVEQSSPSVVCSKEPSLHFPISCSRALGLTFGLQH